jgi:hypothetical protein
MGVGWRDSREVLAGLLHEQSQDPDRLTDVEATWRVFRSFLALPIDGLEPDPGSDADGFIVQWGRYSWNDRRPSLSFTRQMAVDVRATWMEPDWYQPEVWHLELKLVFEDSPALVDLGQLGVRNTGFNFSPPGPEQDRVFGRIGRQIQQYPALQALWASTPMHSSLNLYNAD